jgi:hypothetical protein
MFKTVAIVIVVLIAIVLIYAATRPDTFHVERSISIKAAPEKIFPLINDFHQWNEWTPYNKDPAMKKIYSGNTSGKGAAYAWEGNKEVGKGAISITGTTPPTKVEFDLHMIEPFEGHNQVIFTLNTTGDSTAVTWGMDGTRNYIVKVMGLFLSMDQMVGKDFETGLAKLKALAEK